MTLPIITISGEDFYDMSSIISPNRYTRPGTIGIALHHSVGAADFPDRNMNGTNMDEEITHIKAIETQHVAQDFGGFGYNAIAFDSGRVYVAGDCMGARAHVASRNGELEGICMAGDYRTRKPSASLVEGVKRYYWARAAVLGEIPIKGHREWAVPGWETSCPGDAGLAVIATILEEPDHSQVEDDMGLTEAEVVKLIDGHYADTIVPELGGPIKERLDALEEWREAVVPVIDGHTALQHVHGETVEVDVGSAATTPVAGPTYLPTPEEIAAAQSGGAANPFR